MKKDDKQIEDVNKDVKFTDLYCSCCKHMYKITPSNVFEEIYAEHDKICPSKINNTTASSNGLRNVE